MIGSLVATSRGRQGTSLNPLVYLPDRCTARWRTSTLCSQFTQPGQPDHAQHQQVASI